jgi:hypothetical protein
VVLAFDVCSDALLAAALVLPVARSPAPDSEDRDSPEASVALAAADDSRFSLERDLPDVAVAAVSVVPAAVAAVAAPKAPPA